MNSSSGIIFADLFITNKELFIDFFSKYYLSRQQELDIIILKLKTALNATQTQILTPANAKEFQEAWKSFEQEVLLNKQDLQLLVAYRGPSGKDATFSQIIKQEKVEGEVNKKYGINTADDIISDSMAALRASKVEQFLQLHLNGLLLQLETPIDEQACFNLYNYHSQFISEAFKKSREPLLGAKWREPFYSNAKGIYFKGSGLGQVYDAFMNHVANYEKEIYSYLSSGGQSTSLLQSVDLKIDKSSVFEEEGGSAPDSHFPQLLFESKNHIGWYTGGDIIIVNPNTMDVVYNIQLKTTSKNKQSLFSEKISALRIFINQFEKMSPKEKSEKLFNFLLTNISNTTDFNTALDGTIDEIVSKQLEKKINLTL